MCTTQGTYRLYSIVAEAEGASAAVTDEVFGDHLFLMETAITGQLRRELGKTPRLSAAGCFD